MWPLIDKSTSLFVFFTFFINMYLIIVSAQSFYLWDWRRIWSEDGKKKISLNTEQNHKQ